MSSLYMVFDVESVGLHGEGFAVGYVVVDETGAELESNTFAASPDTADGTRTNRAWIAQHVLPHLDASRFLDDPLSVRRAFWTAWEAWKAKGARLAADCAWPVESRFLTACVDDDEYGGREWGGPYPLIDIASVRLAAGRDPLATEARRHNELPAHHPLADARQSARLLIEALP